MYEVRTQHFTSARLIIIHTSLDMHMHEEQTRVHTQTLCSRSACTHTGTDLSADLQVANWQAKPQICLQWRTHGSSFDVLVFGGFSYTQRYSEMNVDLSVSQLATGYIYIFLHYEVGHILKGRLSKRIKISWLWWQ